MTFSTRHATPPVLAFLAAVALAACGTTVPQQTTLGAGTQSGQSVSGATSDQAGATAAAGAEPDDAAQAAAAAAAQSGTTSVSQGAAPGGGTGTAPAAGSAAISPTVIGGSARPEPNPSAAAKSAKPAAVTKGATVSKSKAAAGKATSSAAAVTSTAPISIGIILTGTSNAASAGFSTGQTLSEQSVDDGLINAVNKAGGVNGRMLAPVYASTDTGSADWAGDFEAACSTFTQDHHVAVVLGYQFTYEQNLEQCLAKNNIPHLDGGFNIPDAGELANYPLHRAYAVPTIDDRTLEKLQGAMATGSLTSKNTLGVFLDDCPGTQSSWTRVGLPFVKAHGLKVGFTSTFTCPNSSAGAASAVGAIPSALLQMRQNNVDRVMFNMTSEGPVLLLVSTAAQSQGYEPGWIVSSLGNLATVASQAPAAEMANVYGYGWFPAQDELATAQPAPNAAQQRCKSMLASQNINLQSAEDYSYAYAICDAVNLYSSALKADGGSTVGSAVIAGVDGLGTSFQSTIALNGATSFGSGHLNNPPQQYRPLTFSSSCTCFSYTGATYTMP